MAEEWRVSLIFNDRPGVRASYYHRTTVRDLLRSRFCDDIAVSAEKMRIFLYAGTVDAAAEAEHVAREVLAQQNLSADFRLERWDRPARHGGTRGPGRRTASLGSCRRHTKINQDDTCVRPRPH